LPEYHLSIAIIELERQESAALILHDDLEIKHLVWIGGLGTRHEGNEPVLLFPRPEVIGKHRIAGKGLGHIRAREPNPGLIEARVKIARALQEHERDGSAWVEKPSGNEDARRLCVQHGILG
jgi:hypothetical protein